MSSASKDARLDEPSAPAAEKSSASFIVTLTGSCDSGSGCCTCSAGALCCETSHGSKGWEHGLGGEGGGRRESFVLLSSSTRTSRCACDTDKMIRG